MWVLSEYASLFMYCFIGWIKYRIGKVNEPLQNNTPGFRIQKIK